MGVRLKDVSVVLKLCLCPATLHKRDSFLSSAHRVIFIQFTPPHQSYADHIEMQLLIRLWQILRRTCSLTQKKKSKTLVYLHYTASVCSLTYRVSNMKTTCSGELFKNINKNTFAVAYRFKSLYIPLQMLLLLTPNIRHCYATTIIYYCYYYYCKIKKGSIINKQTR